MKHRVFVKTKTRINFCQDISRARTRINHW